jgi:hypothetical protein
MVMMLRNSRRKHWRVAVAARDDLRKTAAGC